MFDLAHDVRSGGRPDKGTGLLIVLPQIVADGLGQFGHAAERSPADALAGDLGKPTLHQVQPRGAPGGVPVSTHSEVLALRPQCEVWT